MSMVLAGSVSLMYLKAMYLLSVFQIVSTYQAGQVSQ